jgi:uncharacterized protein YbbC (DUF1343 family)
MYRLFITIVMATAIFGCSRQQEVVSDEPGIAVESRESTSTKPENPDLKPLESTTPAPAGMPGTIQVIPPTLDSTTEAARLRVPPYVAPGTYASPPTTRTLVAVESRQIGEGPTLTGLDMLKREGFARLRGKKLALLTNHSAIDREGNHILDLMFGQGDLQLVKLFSPEHGLYGDVDTKTADAMDTATGLMIHSLYSNRRDPETKPHHPRLADLEGIDAVVVDMQDIGARYYTYSSYMAYMMEACAKLGTECIVLDRPNPIGGMYVDGPLLDEDKVGSVTAYFRMPIAHGMTMGELAQMFNAENKIGCKLTVVPAENWKRAMYLDETGLRWVDPSPNIQDLDAALVYPGIAITEAMVSMGRGTDEPFHVFGTPWIENPEEMVDFVMKSGLKGVRLEATDFTPTGTLARHHVGEGRPNKGARIHITDRREFRAVALGAAVMQYLQGKYGKQYVQGAGGQPGPRYDVMAIRTSCNAVMCARIREQAPLDGTMKYIDGQVAAFLPVRAKYLIYEE